MSVFEMAKDTKQSTNTQRGRETANTGKQPGKPASQTSPKGPQPSGGKKTR
jgi:hypothetical protein